MKIRTGFVSNSSSSSFIVIADGKKDIPDLHDEKLVAGQQGHTDFGWDEDDFCDFHSKFNFVCLQLEHMIGDEHERATQLLNSVIEGSKLEPSAYERACQYLHNVMQETRVREIEIPTPGRTWGYIDHQSSAEEGRNLEMFRSEEALSNFLFCAGSYIHTDNDNH